MSLKTEPAGLFNTEIYFAAIILRMIIISSIKSGYSFHLVLQNRRIWTWAPVVYLSKKFCPLWASWISGIKEEI